MGTDCELVTEKQVVYLDRWYTFSEYIKEETVYTKLEFCYLIKQLMNYHVDEFIDGHLENSYVPDIDYLLLWCSTALKNCGVQPH